MARTLCPPLHVGGSSDASLAVSSTAAPPIGPAVALSHTPLRQTACERSASAWVVVAVERDSPAADDTLAGAGGGPTSAGTHQGLIHEDPFVLPSLFVLDAMVHSWNEQSDLQNLNDKKKCDHEKKKDQP